MIHNNSTFDHNQLNWSQLGEVEFSFSRANDVTNESLVL